MCSQINTIFSTTFRVWHKPEDTPIHPASALLLVLLFAFFLLLFLLLLFTSNVIFIGVHCENWLRYTSCTCFCLPFACTTWRMRILAPAFKIKCALYASMYVRLCVCVYALCARTPAFVTLPVCVSVWGINRSEFASRAHEKKQAALLSCFCALSLCGCSRRSSELTRNFRRCILYRVVSLAYK